MIRARERLEVISAECLQLGRVGTVMERMSRDKTPMELTLASPEC